MVNVAEFGENQNMDEGIQDQNIAEGGEDETIAEGGEDENVAETDENQNIPEVVVKEEPLDAHECGKIYYFGATKQQSNVINFVLEQLVVVI